VETYSKKADEIAVRSCGERDESFLFALFTSVRTGDFAALGWPPEQLEPLLRIQFAAQSQSYAAQHPRAVREIICAGEAPIGSIITDEDAEGVCLIDVALLPEHRGRGTGTALIRALQNRCARAGRPLRLHVAGNNPAIRLYERLGFITTGGTEVYRLMEWTPPG